MEWNKRRIKHQVVGFVLAVVLGMTFFSTAGAKPVERLLDSVVSLQLGLNGYVIGEKLDAAHKDIAGKNPVEGAYEGTYKFIDNDLYVVVDTKTDRVLALYKQKKNADKNQLKAMVVELMNRFDSPTSMAHEKILYWAFNRHGAVSEEDFDEAKKIQQTAALGIIATVKLNSEMEISPDTKEEKERTTEGKSPAIGTIYFIITSEPLVKEFMRAQQQ